MDDIPGGGGAVERARTADVAGGRWAWAALVVAAAGLAGSLFLSWGLGLKACPLCFYQRTFVMALVAVLGVGLVFRIAPPARLGLLALPLAVAGLGVAAFHVWLEASGKLECPGGLLGLGSAPQQSLAVFLLLSALSLATALRPEPPSPVSGAALTGSVVLGMALAAAACTSNPPMPGPPAKPYDGPPEVCRPPYPSR
jgi:disulfide bond formation protein DsbB